jgi:hypothetical protein
MADQELPGYSGRPRKLEKGMKQDGLGDTQSQMGRKWLVRSP